jgi:uncharacterized protein (TIGR00269 family)
MTKKYLCRQHFIELFEQRVKKSINKYKMLNKFDHIGLGYSGGKDSSVLLHILSKVILKRYSKNQITLITVDEGIKGYREGFLELTKKNSSKYNFTHKIVSFVDLYGATLDEIIDKSSKTGSSLSACAICGILRRRALNYGSQMAKVTKIATAHNLDDESQSIIMNLLRGDTGRFKRIIRTPIKKFPSLIPRIRPFVRISEPEIVLYAHANDLEYHAVPCPYAYTAMRNDIRRFLSEMEKKRPSTLINIVNVHDSLSQYFDSSEVTSTTYFCRVCKELTTQKICPVCQLFDTIGLKIKTI